MSHVVNGGSLLVSGPPGVGKSHFTKSCCDQLMAAGKRVAVIAKSHVASSRVGGVMADHWVRKYLMHGSAQFDAIWIEEYSQLDIELWGHLNKMAHAGCQWLLSGDPDQFAPVRNNWRGCAVRPDALESSQLLHFLVGGAVLRLHECRRSSRQLFDFYTHISLSRELPIGDLV